MATDNRGGNPLRYVYPSPEVWYNLGDEHRYTNNGVDRNGDQHAGARAFPSAFILCIHAIMAVAARLSVLIGDERNTHINPLVDPQHVVHIREARGFEDVGRLLRPVTRMAVDGYGTVFAPGKARRVFALLQRRDKGGVGQVASVPFLRSPDVEKDLELAGRPER
eukprot:CAMPEP_0181113004 /NCGR_PEP_ID=MMETSP1071-20121207/20112_1 /TAXON_ID=35127 /ORGANISM="Thalassiosira sp., Strain NH16" /LENGTH=164 /DNA_ID=CAMNT_0023197005 /DNA_START=327 /DNA_END=821 /DNA_ORIENTATION=+